MGSLFGGRKSSTGPFAKALYDLENRLWRVGRGNEAQFLTHDGQLMVLRTPAWRDLLVGWGQLTLHAVGEGTSAIQTRVPGLRIPPDASIPLWLTLNRLMRTNVFELVSGLTKGDQSASSLAADLMYLPIFRGTQQLWQVEGSRFSTYLSLSKTEAAGRALRCSRDCLDLLGRSPQMDETSEVAIPLALLHTAHGNTLVESVAGGEPRAIDFERRLNHHLDELVRALPGF